MAKINGVATLMGVDYVIKKLLKNKADFGILEGFLSKLLMEDIKIDHFIESETTNKTLLLLIGFQTWDWVVEIFMHHNFSFH